MCRVMSKMHFIKVEVLILCNLNTLYVMGDS